MNWKLTIYCLGIAFFVLYMFYADYIFNILLKVENEAIMTTIELPEETDEILSSLGEVGLELSQWKEVLAFKGWAVKKNTKENARELFMVLQSKKNLLIFDIENDTIKRERTARKLKLDKNIIKIGFEFNIPQAILKESYNVGFVIEDDSGKYYTKTNKILKKEKDTYSLVNADSSSRKFIENTELNLEEDILLLVTNLKKKSSTKEVKYNISKIINNKNQFKIEGWGFLENLDAKKQEVYITIKRKGKEIIYKSKPISRPDITKHFSNTKLNLDNAGFKITIPKNKLKKGKYRVGLYIENGEDAGEVYFNKFITVI